MSTKYLIQGNFIKYLYKSRYYPTVHWFSQEVAVSGDGGVTYIYLYIYIIYMSLYTLCRAVQCRQADQWEPTTGWRPFSTNQRQRRLRLVDSFLTQHLRLKIGENYVFKIIFLTPSKSQKSILRVYSESAWPQASNNGLKRCCSSRNDREIRCVSEM